MNGKRVAVLVLVAVLLILAACTAGPNSERDMPTESGFVAGFWQGLWHGIIMPVTFVISLFNQNVGIYEIHNNGHWYNFGFVLGAGVLLGGLHGGSRRGRGLGSRV